MHLQKLVVKANGKKGLSQGGVITPLTQKVTLASWGAVGPTRSRWAATGRGRRRNRNAVSDDDVVIADQHLFNDETHDSLTLHDIKRIGGAAEAAEATTPRCCQRAY